MLGDVDNVLSGITIDEFGDILLTNIENFGTVTSSIIRHSLPIVGTNTATLVSSTVILVAPRGIAIEKESTIFREPTIFALMLIAIIFLEAYT